MKYDVRVEMPGRSYGIYKTCPDQETARTYMTNAIMDAQNGLFIPLEYPEEAVNPRYIASFYLREVNE